MILEDDLNRACQAVGFLATEIERRMRAGKRRETATRHAWELLEIKTHQQKPLLLRIVDKGSKREWGVGRLFGLIK